MVVNKNKINFYFEKKIIKSSNSFKIATEKDVKEFKIMKLQKKSMKTIYIKEYSS
jgi:hypothetical protein